MKVLTVDHPLLECREVRCPPRGQQEREQCAVVSTGAYKVYQQQEELVIAWQGQGIIISSQCPPNIQVYLRRDEISVPSAHPGYVMWS
ncbi:hypothetical protein E2C01_058926 [Portunus trituberculatus]|uniref:Uncharacterized protein n=1 Tax=Portunus trituberculatus TaxID=210409 RepID=A0A5B7H7P0_PORTR|nr:hypothetical protein [Portunus trituberculatus]